MKPQRGYAIVRRNRIQKTADRTRKGGDIVVTGFDVFATRGEAEYWATTARGKASVMAVDLVPVKEEQ